MNSHNNKVQLIGNIGQAPEIRTLDNGNKMARDATGGFITETTWHNIVIWGKQVEVIEKYVSKGNNDKRYITEIHVQSFKLLGSKELD